MQGLVALVTGGASGLGRATAERIVRHGGKVLICDLPTSSGQVVAKTLGENCAYAAADVSFLFQSLYKRIFVSLK